MQKGDVYKTWTDISQLKSLTGYIPQVKLKEGIGKFIKWYLTYTTSNKVNKI